MDIDILENAIKFLSRVQLTGQEVPAFNQVMSALTTEWDAKRNPDPDA